MSYPERRPIYTAYEAIIKKIIEEKTYKTYAESEISALDTALLAAFKEIRQQLLSKKWPSEK